MKTNFKKYDIVKIEGRKGTYQIEDELAKAGYMWVENVLDREERVLVEKSKATLFIYAKN